MEKEFAKDLRKQIFPGDDPYLIFSGDVVQSGSDTGLYDKVMKKYDSLLSEVGITKEKRIVCPGNHDVNRDVAKQGWFMRLSAFKNCDGENSFNQTVWPETKSHVASKFENFCAFESAFSAFPKQDIYDGGWGGQIREDFGIFVLNSALCSFGGIKDDRDQRISDKGILHIYTRSIHKWIQETSFSRRLLVVHHPMSWLSPWAAKELTSIIDTSFDVVMSGHEHTQDAYSFARNSSSVMIEAPALFSRKDEDLGYSVISLEHDQLDIKYRQWIKKKIFVLGVSMAGDDSGIMNFPFKQGQASHGQSSSQTSKHLKDNLDRALACYHKLPNIWVSRVIANHSETSVGEAETAYFDFSRDASNDIVIKAPPQFGLTSLGRFIPWSLWESHPQYYTAFLNADDLQPHESAIKDAVKSQIEEDEAPPHCLSSIIIDNWRGDDDRHLRMANNLKKEFPSARLVFLSLLDREGLSSSLYEKLKFPLESWYLWSLDRQSINEFVEQYVVTTSLPDSVTVANRIISDLDDLNIHRTPMNCINLLKSIELHFDESPVNRTEVLERVLNLLFSRFHQIPRYSTKPDLKDCQFAIGGLCEKLFRTKNFHFTKSDFNSSIAAYCDKKSISLDIDILFHFLLNEGILVKTHALFSFRFSYWLHFFAAHRMRHSDAFLEYVLENRRYAYCPELIEFYSGIDRHREDLITRLTIDLKFLNDNLLERTKIPEEFTPYDAARWKSSDKQVIEIEKEISKSAEASALPLEIKNKILDRTFDRSSAYRQNIREFLEEVSFGHTVGVMQAASKALRNSEHVDKDSKMKLLVEILRTWKKSIQLGVILCPILVDRGIASFDGFGIHIIGMPDDISDQEKFLGIISSMPRGICMSFHRHLFSKKNGPLFFDYLKTMGDDFCKLLASHLISIQRPVGWRDAQETYIASLQKDSFYLGDVLQGAMEERKLGFVSPRDSEDLRMIVSKSLAKHLTGQDRPGKKAADEAWKQIIDKD